MNKPGRSSLSREIHRKAHLKLKSRQDDAPGIWFGLGMMGLIGWSVAIPTLLGAALGLWLDKRFTGNFPWTLSLLLAGLVLGCMNAWLWIGRERGGTGKEEDTGDE